MGMKVIPVVIDTLGTVHRGLERGLEELETNRDTPNYSIVEIGLNIEKSPEALKKCYSNSSERSSA